MNRTKFCFTAFGIDVGAVILSFLLFGFVFLATLQKELLAVYQTIDVQQVGEYSYSTIGSTSNISFLLVGFVLFFFFFWFLADTTKVLLLFRKNVKRLIGKNLLTWIVFAFAIVFMSLFLQELYVFFSFTLITKILFSIIVNLVFAGLLFGVCLGGKKKLWLENVKLKNMLFVWAGLAVVGGFLCVTLNPFAITLLLILYSVLYNYTLHYLTQK